MNAFTNKLATRVRLRESGDTLRETGSIGFDAILRGRVVGHVSASRHDSTMVINELEVSPDARCRGVGRKLVKAILNQGRLLSADRASVSARGNQGFWALQGFRPADEIAEGEYPAMVMTRTLPPVAPANPFR